MAEFSEATSATALSKETKKCGHLCYPSSVPMCCACSDLRPVLEGNAYPAYVDGEGWTDNATRDAYYCHVCNPTNYSSWAAKIEHERRAKLIEEARLQEEQRQRDEDLKRDRERAAAMETNKKVEFTYSDGSVYVGQMTDGFRQGDGHMTFDDGSTYDGHWISDKMEGYGVRNWLDGIEYKGEWKNDMMEGRGTYTLQDGSVIEGLFSEDTFIE